MCEQSKVRLHRDTDSEQLLETHHRICVTITDQFSNNAHDAFECLVVTEKRLPIVKGFHAPIVREIGHLCRNNGGFGRIYPVPHMPHKVVSDRDFVEGGRCTS